MKIPIDQIFPDPDLPRPNKMNGRRETTRSVRSKRDPVVLSTDGGYVLLAGERKLTAAREAGEISIECTVKEEVTPQERWELSLAEQYHSALVPAMSLGRAFMEYRDMHEVTQQELARRTGITPGTIHHYESLIRTLDPGLGEKVNNGELTFKEARSIADIEDHARQREIAQPFIEGRLSSVHVERIVGRAKTSATLSIEEIIEEVVNGKRAPEREPEPAPVIQPARPIEADTALIENAVLKIAGELDALQLQVIPEYRRLKLISSLRILDSRLKSALLNLNGGVAAVSAIPRQLSTSRVPV
ncbi:MAG: ParB N-terminal domain-containing protein [Chloroflexi bacterium]|nr:ParB N-terminal domain-containing protein [Chloroflexota bacterium]